MLDVVHLRLDVEQRLKRAAGFVEDGPAGMGQTVLRQIADGEGGGVHDAARVGLLGASQNLQQGCLACPVRAAQTDTIPVVDLAGDVVEEGPVAEGLGEVGKLNHAAGVTISATSQSNTLYSKDLGCESGCRPRWAGSGKDTMIERMALDFARAVPFGFAQGRPGSG